MPQAMRPSKARAGMATTISKFRSPGGRCAPRSRKRPASRKEISDGANRCREPDRPSARPRRRPLKVTGRAKYAFEYAAQGEAAYGFIVSAAIGKGRVTG